MELKYYQNAWQGVSFDRVKSREKYKTRVGDAGFYQEFYTVCGGGEGSPGEEWVSSKQSMSRWIEHTFLEPLRQRKGDAARILSVGAGTGIMEEPWIRGGYLVDLQECQKASLDAFSRAFPQVKIHICDARAIPVEDESYDWVLICVVDYVFDRKQYCQLLREARRTLKPEGRVVCVSSGNLSLEAITKHAVKRTFSRLGIKQFQEQVFWGWKRTVGEHIRVGRQVGMRTMLVYMIEPVTCRVQRIIREGEVVLLPLRSSNAVVEWERTAGGESHPKNGESHGGKT